MGRVRLFLRARLGWFIALALILLAGASVQAYRSVQTTRARAQALAALRTEGVTYGDLVYRVSATGSILPERQSNLFFLIPGTVREVLVESGDSVRAGQVLAHLDATSLRLAVQQAEDALAVAKLDRQKLLAGPAPGDVAVAQANLRSANAAVSDLLKGAGPEEVNIAQMQYDSLQSAYQQAADRYNGAVEAAEQDPGSAPPQQTLDLLKLNMEGAYYAAEIGRLQVELARQGAGQGTLSVAYARVAQAKAALDQIQAPISELQIRQADLAVAQAQLALDRAQLLAARAELVAPFDGVVAAVNLKVGEAVSGMSPAVVLLDTGRFHLDVTVDETDVAQLVAGQTVSVTVDALPGASLSGRVDRVAPAATSVGGIVNYAVRVLLDPTDVALHAGMSATARITVAEVKEVLLVPNWAIRRDRRSGQAYASLKVGDQLTDVPIETGLRGEAYTEVKSGVKAGDTAAVSTARDQLNVFGGGN